MKITIRLNNYIVTLKYYKNMLKILLPLLLIITSCYKIEGRYRLELEVTNTRSWKDDYEYSGEFIKNGGRELNNPLINTKWLITKTTPTLQSQLYTKIEINFKTIDGYIFNDNAERLYSYSPSTSILIIEQFYPFGYSNYKAKIDTNMIKTGELNNIEFTDLQNNTKIIKVWLKKI